MLLWEGMHFCITFSYFGLLVFSKKKRYIFGSKCKGPFTSKGKWIRLKETQIHRCTALPLKHLSRSANLEHRRTGRRRRKFNTLTL